MRLLFLSKRSPQGRDLITRPYGRFYHLPQLLAQAGHEVEVLLLGYRGETDAQLARQGVRWVTRNLRPWGPLPYLRLVRRRMRDWRPDWVIGLSDTYYGILAEHLARIHGCHSLIDAYDNYESYLPRAHSLHLLWRRALRQATLVSAAGPQLGHFMTRDRPLNDAIVLPMAADPVFAPPMDRDQLRRAFGLSPEAQVVAYCGSLHPNRDGGSLAVAWAEVLARRPELQLVISGRRFPGLPLPTNARHLGYLDDAQVPELVACTDLLLVLNRDSSFGNYSYPVKLYEAMRCNVNVLASATASVRWILRNHPERLVPPESPSDLAQAILATDLNCRPDYGTQPTWKDTVDILNNALNQTLNSPGFRGRSTL